MSEVTKLSLSSLLVSTKEAEVDFPGYEGFKLKLCFLSREETVKLRKKSTKIVFKNRQPSEEFNDELFLQLYSSAAVKGWSGFKLKYLEKLAPVELPASVSPEDELPYSPDSALELFKNSPDFDSYVTDTCSSLENFQNNSGKK